jgi:predicted transposase YdaD
MQEYDVALKLLLQGSARLTIRELAGGPVVKWLDMELPKMQNLRMDLLGEMIESEEVGDNVIAILAGLRDHRDAVRKIVGKIASLAAAEREAALSQLLILAGLRSLEETVAREIQKMPVYIDILENKVLGPPYKKGLEEGRQEGLEEGRREGERAILRRLIEKRFGAVPSWAEERLVGRSTIELEDLSVRVLDAQSIEDLLR